MDRGITIFFGTLLTFASAWFGLVVAPYWQLNNTQPLVADGKAYPIPYQGNVARGRQVYIANGCIYCHSQQVRQDKYYDANGKEHQFSADVPQWGPRRTVPRDYVYDQPVQLGTMRTGPDLVNIGSRRTDPVWHHQHLYYPQMVAGSVMAPFRHLYEIRKVVGEPTKDAVWPSWARLANASLDERPGILLELPLELWPTEMQRAWKSWQGELAKWFNQVAELAQRKEAGQIKPPARLLPEDSSAFARWLKKAETLAVKKQAGEIPPPPKGEKVESDKYKQWSKTALDLAIAGKGKTLRPPVEVYTGDERSRWEAQALQLARAGKAGSAPSPPELPSITYEIVPTEDARALVAYLLSMDRTFPLEDADR